MIPSHCSPASTISISLLRVYVDALAARLRCTSHKFKSGCKWPAYFDAIANAVTRHVDRLSGMGRTEIVYSDCGGHLGYVSNREGYPTHTDETLCQFYFD